MVEGSMAQIVQAMLMGSWISENGGRKLGGFSAHPNQVVITMEQTGATQHQVKGDVVALPVLRSETSASRR
jgi:hypothetical protein